MGERGTNVERMEIRRGIKGGNERKYLHMAQDVSIQCYMEFNSVLSIYSQQIQRQQVEPNYYPNG